MMHYFRLQWKRGREIVDQRYVAIDANDAKAALAKAKALKDPTGGAPVPGDAKLHVQPIPESTLLDEHFARAFLLTAVGPGSEQHPNVREQALAETLNLLREAIDNPDNQILLEDGRTTISLEALKKAVSSGLYGEAYAEGEGFRQIRNQIVSGILKITERPPTFPKQPEAIYNGERAYAQNPGG